MFEHRIHNTAEYAAAEDIHVGAAAFAKVQLGKYVHLECDDAVGTVHVGKATAVSEDAVTIDSVGRNDYCDSKRRRGRPDGRGRRW